MPVLAVLLFLVILRMPATRAMPLALVITTIMAWFIWKIPVDYIAASVIEGWVIAFGITIIVFGAIVLLPLLMITMLTRFFGEQRSWLDGLRLWPFAIFGGLAFTLPAYAVAVLLGPEFPSIFGGIIGLIVVITAVKIGFLQPKQPWGFGQSNDDNDLNETLIPNTNNGSSLKPMSPDAILCTGQRASRHPILSLGLLSHQ